MVAAGAVVLVLAIALAAVGQYLAARLQAAAAADAAALAAAPVTFAPYGAAGSPREEAARFAAENGARLVACTCPYDPGPDPRRVDVEVEREVRVLGIGTVTVRARSSAEFTPPPLVPAAGSGRGERGGLPEYPP